MKKMETIINAIENTPDGILGELYGDDPTEKQQQVKRYLSLINKFRSFSEASDAALFTSPWRTEIGGNHTDHNYGRVLAGAVNLDNIAVAAPNGANIIRIQSDGYPSFEVNLSILQPDKSD